jgi:hypothetical protein
MASRILSLALLACLAGGAIAPASAETTTATSETRCSRDKWSGVYRCHSEYDSPYSNITRHCTSGGPNGRHCETDVRLKPQPTPRVPDPPYAPPPLPTVERDPTTGVAVMRGLPR